MNSFSEIECDINNMLLTSLININSLNRYTGQGAWRGSSVRCASAWYADGRGFDPHVRQHSFVEIGHEIISRLLSPIR